ncbi:MAG: Stk1 family PASTA domain-containing Ser/Thr kinase [Ferrimicrobium sp.]
MVARRGAGGAGMVYRAVDDRLGRTIAVKVLHRSLSGDPVFLRRFTAEARASASLNHPNIMRVFDWGEDNDEPYLILEYLPGGSLRDLLVSGASVTRAQLVRLGEESSSALAYAHDRNYLHRDIKPANLIFDEDGRVRIADFGLVRALTDTSLTETGGGILGTPRYLSPEQAEGKGSVPASDLYSLGLVLYEVAFGSVPFQGDTQLELALARLSTPIHNPTPGDAVAETIYAMVARQPQDRPSASQIATRFAEIARQLPKPSAIVSGERDRRPVVPTPEMIMDGSDLTSVIDATDVVGRPGVAMPQDTTVRVGDVMDRGGRDGTRVDGFDDYTQFIARNGLVEAGSDGAVGSTKLLDEEQGKTRSRWWWIALIILVVLALIAAGGYLVYSKYRPVVVPRLAAITLASARSRLKVQDLALGRVSYAYSSGVPAGIVLRQTPGPGATLHPSQMVAVVVSQGHAPVRVPSVVKETLGAAEHALGALGFGYSVTSKYSATVSSGQIISQSVTNRVIRYGSTIDLVVSKGPAPRPVPSMVGESEAVAQGQLSSSGLNFQVTQQYSTIVSLGQVISQSLTPGQMVLPGTTVTISVSLGPHIVSVPNVIDDSISQAEAAMGQAGLSISGIYGPKKAAVVIYTVPSAGTNVLYGSGVTLYAQ